MVAGFALLLAGVFPFIGTIIACVGLVIGFAGWGLFAAGTKRNRDGRSNPTHLDKR